ncbi:MAG: hypothetical protein B7Y25_01425 [Alphaproteobacteria bacterium 16-39-46]|nr:MAG: hypothetical protein B7Y25_01425 [Alphaproteobacteria bacterium 16-39-46]OZA44076.1 MAG: hypothetical protein B7X84_01410 [Alphaproteobacteria bacterium 17-39-52]HQS83592.1 hypothetical protein [Alphaproteobacteria bacterium]HQS93381.1 hypothetical protein [Alphaproteobacteria bacterium]
MQEVKRSALTQKSFLIFGACLVMIGTQGCGKKGPLDPPVGEVSTYPAPYPQYADGPDEEEVLGSLDDQGLENWPEQPLLKKEAV